jgi:hypothetical protein
MTSPTRRTLLKTATVLWPLLPAASWRAAPGFSAAKPMRITDVVLDLDNLHKWDNSNGDIWDPFWADDDNLYAFNCDGRGFGKEAETSPSTASPAIARPISRAP